MIPKIIHYCWFGGNPLPPLAKKCIASWKKFFPDYEIKEWNESNFDFNIIPYTKEAYEAKKYAFVSDYARFWILYHHGGLYFDTDVEVIKNMDNIIAKGPFMGREEIIKPGVNPGLGLGVNPGLGLYKEIMEKYSTLHFFNQEGTLNQTTVVTYTTDILCQYGLKAIDEIQYIEGIYIYPKEYFCPKSYKDGKIYLTENTVTIHHFAGSWHNNSQKMAERIGKYSPTLVKILVYIKHAIKKMH